MRIELKLEQQKGADCEKSSTKLIGEVESFREYRCPLPPKLRQT